LIIQIGNARRNTTSEPLSSSDRLGMIRAGRLLEDDRGGGEFLPRGVVPPLRVECEAERQVRAARVERGVGEGAAGECQYARRVGGGGGWTAELDRDRGA